MRTQSPITVPRTVTALEAQLARVQYLIKKRRYGQAVTVLQPLFVTPPERWEPWFWLGTAKLGLGEWKEAETSFVEGLARDATVPQLWVQRALVGQQQGKFGEALESLRQAELIAPKLPKVQLNLAYSLEVQGYIKNAVEHYYTFLALTEGKNSYLATRKKVLERIIQLENT
jgi:tetratricopeptide (TPR) repeat protein